MFHRNIKILKSESFFVFGARGTGKSTLISGLLEGTSPLVFDLLDPVIEDSLARDPQRLVRELQSLPQTEGRPHWVVIDEVQKLPKLLGLVHQLIEKKAARFALTGSSARKLKRGGANLLAGRAFVYHLFPLTREELADSFDLNQALRFGTLPKIFQLGTDEEKLKFLQSYALTYLKEEVQAEQLVRRLDPFRQFLEVAAQMNGKILNLTKIGRDVGADVKSVQSYFSILEETWLGFYLPAFHLSIRKAQKVAPKFYFFDTGIARSLAGVADMDLRPGTFEYGQVFEHWMILECFRANAYRDWNFRLSHLRTKDDQEIDLILHGAGRPLITIEIKSSSRVAESEVRKFQALAEDLRPQAMLWVSQDPATQRFEKVECLHWSALIPRIEAILGEWKTAPHP